MHFHIWFGYDNQTTRIFLRGDNMKALIIALAILGSTSASARVDLNFGDPPIVNDWSLFVISQACHVKLASLKTLTGTMDQVSDGFVYRAWDKNGNEVMRAHAKRNSLFAKKTCL